MPRKSAVPTAPATEQAAPPKTRRSRTKTSAMGCVALWIGDNPKPKRWFDTLADAKACLSEGGVKHKPGDAIRVAELQTVTLNFTVNIGGGPAIP